MFTKTLHIALHYLSTTYRSRTVLIFAIAMPLIFTFVLGSVIGGPANGESPRWQIAVVNADAGALGETLIARLAAHPALDVQEQSETQALAAVKAEEMTAAVLIPADYSAALLAGAAPMVDYIAGSEVRSAQSVQMAVQAALSEMDGLTQAAAIATATAEQLDLFDQPGQDRQAYFQEALALAQTQWAATPPLTVHSAAVTRMQAADDVPDGFAQSSPGMLVTFALVGILNGAIVLDPGAGAGHATAAAGAAPAQERHPRRQAGGDLHRRSVASGRAHPLRSLRVWRELGASLRLQAPLALLVLLIGFVFAVTSLGMLIAGLARTYAQANALANILMYSVAALGGAWWPIEITPAWMQRLAQITPTYWAMQGFHDIITRGLGLQAILGRDRGALRLRPSPPQHRRLAIPV